METTKAALEHDRKIQQLQMQAIHALWKKVSQMGPSTNSSNTLTEGSTSTASTTQPHPSMIEQNTENTDTTTEHPAAVVQDLAKTCTILTNQVQQLQGSMRDVLNCITLFCNISQTKTLELESEKQNQSKETEKCDSCSTQTEIIAVNTPQIENLPFPFVQRQPPRPSSLPLASSIDSQKLTSDVIVENVEEIQSPHLTNSDSNLLEDN